MLFWKFDDCLVDENCARPQPAFAGSASTGVADARSSQLWEYEKTESWVGCAFSRLSLIRQQRWNFLKMADYQKYLGKYNRVSAEKYDEFLSELGVNFLLRKAATASTPVFEVNKIWNI